MCSGWHFGPSKSSAGDETTVLSYSFSLLCSLWVNTFPLKTHSQMKYFQGGFKVDMGQMESQIFLYSHSLLKTWAWLNKSKLKCWASKRNVEPLREIKNNQGISPSSDSPKTAETCTVGLIPRGKVNKLLSWKRKSSDDPQNHCPYNWNHVLNHQRQNVFPFHFFLVIFKSTILF